MNKIIALQRTTFPLSPLPITQFFNPNISDHKTHTLHRIGHLKGLNRLEWVSLRCHFALQRISNHPNGCHAKITTFNSKTNEVEPGFIHSYVFSTHLKQYTTKTINKVHHYSVPLPPEYKHWLHDPLPILFTVFDQDSKKLYSKNIQSFFKKYPQQNQRLPAITFKSNQPISKQYLLSLQQKKNKLVSQRLKAFNSANKENIPPSTPLKPTHSYKSTNQLTTSKNNKKKRKKSATPLAPNVQNKLAKLTISTPLPTLKKRNISHVRGDKGSCFFEWKALEAGFFTDITPAESDYGIDASLYTLNKNFELEPGCVQVQIKAKKTIKYTPSSAIFNDLETQHIYAWLHTCFPVILVLVDTDKNCGFWLHIQSYFQNKSLTKKYNTVYIPLSNKLTPQGFQKIRSIKNDLFLPKSKL
ncbi:hypothetical protein DID75_01255 [Candidatus Marinamargulisbacteria bacterium SCGC AG-410-N11]|nr:hypothetical protein DID75_01255 [Candidatus Marinamargulisbacteria bacterium SCGC AG-410-N11]